MQTFRVRSSEEEATRSALEFTVATKLRGSRAEKFKKLAEENRLSYSKLVNQMIDHCMSQLSLNRRRQTS